MNRQTQKNAMANAVLERTNKSIPEGPPKETTEEDKFAPITDIIETERMSYDEGTTDMKTAIQNIISGLQGLLEGMSAVAKESPGKKVEETPPV